eukprot:TRINITY_DN585_c0_g2_i2.p1 TRINITY_DN585_c0_g2~~TRINITY_DN585_c0_g2_i2.p1  ORF type:complete len:241 (-),score=33.17 TRINITY_DN585_c0_g2_i2:345-1067(-)
MATFCSGILQQLDYSLLKCQALVLAHTQKVAQQIENMMLALAMGLPMKLHTCVGKTSVREDQQILRAGVHVVIGCPGRVNDMLRRNALRTDAIKCFALNESDVLLSKMFKDSVYEIFQLLPPKLRVGVLSTSNPMLPHPKPQPMRAASSFKLKVQSLVSSIKDILLQLEAIGGALQEGTKVDLLLDYMAKEFPGDVEVMRKEKPLKFDDAVARFLQPNRSTSAKSGQGGAAPPPPQCRRS